MRGLRGTTWATIGLFVLMYAVFALQFPAIATPRVVGNLLTDSAYLGVLAVGMTIVVVSGGIDLSIGAVMAFASLLIAVAIGDWGLHPLVAFGLALGLGTLFGAVVGGAIHLLEAPPFIVTLTAMFLARGGALLLSQESVPVRHPLYATLAEWGVPLPGGGSLTVLALLMLVAFIAGGVLLHATRFGSRIYAIGGDRRAALLMGAPVGRTTVLIYAVSGFMAALAGVVFSIYTQAGYALSGVGVELEAIAAVVIGGALLSGGAGGMVGSFFGVAIQGLILTYITFEGSLTSWWSKIVIGLLILFFLVVRTATDKAWFARLLLPLGRQLRPERQAKGALKPTGRGGPPRRG